MISYPSSITYFRPNDTSDLEILTYLQFFCVGSLDITYLHNSPPPQPHLPNSCFIFFCCSLHSVFSISSRYTAEWFDNQTKRSHTRRTLSIVLTILLRTFLTLYSPLPPAAISPALCLRVCSVLLNSLFTGHVGGAHSLTCQQRCASCPSCSLRQPLFRFLCLFVGTELWVTF